MTLVYVHGGVSGTAATPPDIAYAVAAARPAAAALDAVELAVRALEDDGALNAGRGSVLNAGGEIELDAGIADGSSGRCGGVAHVRVRHPVTLARRVLEDTPHVLVTGEGARALGQDMDELEGPTDAQQARYEEARAGGTLVPALFGDPERVDTVGAVALDDAGRLAAASSTGGVFGKLAGRVGDAPVCGAGVYATERAAVVGTGVGELFLETLASLRVADLIASGRAPQDACEQVLHALGRRHERWAAGLLALDAGGRVGAAYRGGSWAVAGPDGPVAAARLA